MLSYFAVLPFENLFLPIYNLVSQKTDTFLSINAGTDADDSAQGEIPPLELYDIDNATYRSWNSPAIIPRDKLTLLLRRAVDGGAAVIAVDVDLTHPDTAENDQRLGLLLKALNESDDPDSPVIVLTRRLLRPLDGNKQVNHGAVFSLPASFIDPYIPVQKKVFWSSTLFSMDGDHVIRRWRNAEVYCSRDGYFSLLPSMQLLATIAYNYKSQGSSPDAALRSVNAKLDAVAGQRKCHGTEAIPSLKSYYRKYPVTDGSIQLGSGDESNVLDLADFGEAERINYRIAPVAEQNTKSQIVVTSAGELESAPARLDVLDRLVLIGATFEESNDLHQNPVSDALIPGIYILANGIDTLQNMRVKTGAMMLLGPVISLVMLIVGALLIERNRNTLWLSTALVVFFLVGALAYSPGQGAAALPFSVFFVVLWYVSLESLNKFVAKNEKI